MLDLGTLSGSGDSVAFGINNSGEVVGESPGDTAPFLYTRGGGMVGLNTLLPANSGWVLHTASAINNHGSIVGYGEFNGQTQVAYRLDPVQAVPEPRTLSLVAIGCVFMLCCVRRLDGRASGRLRA
jgi:probable HAF family extracellular repeat protein